MTRRFTARRVLATLFCIAFVIGMYFLITSTMKSNSQTITVTGTISNIQIEQMRGSSKTGSQAQRLYFTLAIKGNDDPSGYYVVDMVEHPEARFTKVGDIVTITYKLYESTSRRPVTEFDNPRYDFVPVS